MTEKNRIPYKVWANSQLSIAHNYWWIKYNWDNYEYDREVVKKMNKSKDDNEKFFPDLVCYK